MNQGLHHVWDRPKFGTSLPRVGKTCSRFAQVRTYSNPWRKPRSVSTRAFLVPDITPPPGQAAATASANIAAAEMMPLWEVGARTAVEIGIYILAARLFIHFVGKLGRRAERVIDSEKTKPSGPNYARVVADAGIQAAQAPVKLIVPLVALLASVRTITQGLQIFVDDEFFRTVHRHTSMILLQLPRAFIPLKGRLLVETFKVLNVAENYANDFWQLGVVVLTVWVLLDWKERLVRIVMDLENKNKEAGGEGFRLDRIVLPMSSLSGWAIILVGALTSLHILGINIQPLLAVGGVSGIAIGFGAQTVTANAIAGVNLFLTRPFVVGDRIELKTTSGGTVLTGVVEKIDPMRTVLRTDITVPVSVPNKSITDMIVCNESRIGASSVVKEFKDPRQYQTKFKIKAADFAKVPKIIGAIENYLGSSNDKIDQNLPHTARVVALGDSGVTIGVTAHTTARSSRDFDSFNHDMLLSLAGILQSNNVAFA